MRPIYNFDMISTIWHEIVCWFPKISQDLPVLACCDHNIVLHWYENQNKNNLVIRFAHSHTASENLLVSPLEGKLQTTISTVVEWHTRIHSTTVDILTLLLWNEIIVCHTTPVGIPLLLWYDILLFHFTTVE